MFLHLLEVFSFFFNVMNIDGTRILESLTFWGIFSLEKTRSHSAYDLMSGKTWLETAVLAEKHGVGHYYGFI